MKQILFTFLFLTCALSLHAQSLDKISRRCPSPNNTAYGSILVQGNGDIVYTPCPNRTSFFNTKLKLLDINYGQPFFNNATAINYFSIGTLGLITVPSTSDFAGSVFNYPLSVSGSGGTYAASKTSINVLGSPVNPTIYGNYTNVTSNSGFFPTGTSEIYGNYTNNDLSFPATRAYGAWFAVSSGGSGASGAGTLTGIAGVVGMAHNGNTANAFAGDFWLASSASTPSLITTAAAVRARTTINPGVTVTNLRGLSLTDWVVNTGTAVNSYGIYADTSIDIGASNSFFIYSLSTSPSRFSGDVYVSDKTKGIILKSPDNNCYRFTVANGGALNAGVLVTCLN